MKKFLVLCLSILMALSLTACGGKTENQGEDAPKTEKAVFLCNVLGDLSFNDSAMRGMNWVHDELGIDVEGVECGMDSTKWESYILNSIEEGADYIVTSSNNGWSDIIFRIAKDYPEVRFIVFDVQPETEVPSDNIACVSYLQNEGSFLVGMIAAGMSETGKVGIVLGERVPILSDFLVGYIDGVLAYNPDASIAVCYPGGWNDEAKTKELTLAQAQVGVDVWFQVAGGSGLGTIAAAAELGRYAIGVDSDQYQELMNAGNTEHAACVVTSMLKNVDSSLLLTFKKIKDGSIKWGGVDVLGIAQDGVGYAINENYEKLVPQDVKDKVAEISQKVVNGEIKVRSFFDMDDATLDAICEEVAPK